MRLRPYIHRHDFEKIQNWITDERTHAMWCANHIKFPLEKEDFEQTLDRMYGLYGDLPFIAVTDEGKAVGFICCSVNYETNEAMLAFVLVSPEERGKGTAVEMLRLASRYCFEILGADAVQLNVFDANIRARKCYEKAGFTERRLEKDAFAYKDELWGRCNMVLSKTT
ncbi:MAG: GNAT family N-acetyltransferase [Oscillospiraceae bacterium]|nr:GNAT family N-acetyltransferase [Oscillospiraceae bacterium]